MAEGDATDVVDTGTQSAPANDAGTNVDTQQPGTDAGADQSGDLGEDGKPDNTPPEYKRVITAEKNRRRTVEAALAEKDRQLSQALEALNRPAPAKEPEKPVVASLPPDPREYDDDDKYRADAQQWLKDNNAAVAREAVETIRKETAEQQRAREYLEKRKGFDKTVAVARTNHADYATVVETHDYPVSEAMADAIMASDIGGELAYYLGSNRDEARRINALPPGAAGREIALIETKVAAALKPKAGVSKAPAPIEPLGSGNKTGPKAREDMTYKEFCADREKEIRIRG